MLKQLFALFLICFFISSDAQSKIDVLSYSFAIELNDDNNTIKGLARISFIAKETVTSFSFDLSNPNKVRKGMTVSNAGFNAPNSSKPTFKHEADKITIDCQQSINKGDSTSVFIQYDGIPSDGLIISKNKYGHRTFFADNWPNRGHHWLPCVDDPSDKAAVEFIVTAPQYYQVVANGILVEETNLKDGKKRTHWKEDVPVASKVMVIGVAEFAVNLAGVIDNCIPVYSWVYPEDRDKGFYDYAQAVEIIPFFIKNVGPYGYKKLANVQSKTTFGGLENANTIFYHENSITGNRSSETLLSHEIAHQWFGNMATEKSFAHIWLSEGFATYMTILYMENKHGADTARNILEDARQQVLAFAQTNEHPVVDDTKDYMELLNANSYQKGGWILHMLRRQLGDSIFWKSIRSYYAAYAGKNADTKDLQHIFEKVSGKDLSTFFQQWLYTPGIPKLGVSWSYLANEKKISITIKQLQKNPFSFPLELQLKNKTKTINVSKQEETFVIPVQEKPAQLVLDPKLSLLFMATVTEKK